MMICKLCLHNKVCRFYLREEDAEKCKQFADEGEYIKVGKYQEKYSTNSTRKTVGQIIREKRKERGWTLKQLAYQIGRDFSTVAAWERDEVTPTLFIVWDLADIFNCSLDELCGRDFEPLTNKNKNVIIDCGL